MITLKQYLEAIEYKISGGYDFLWDSFGPNVRSIDCEVLDKFSISALFDTQTQEVYSVEAYDYINERCYRLINPDYISSFVAECIERNVEYNIAYDGVEFIDLETDNDMLEKVNAIVNGRPYDTRVVIPLDLDDDLILDAALNAHEKDITLNEYLTNCVMEEVSRVLQHDSVKEDSSEEFYHYGIHKHA